MFDVLSKQQCIENPFPQSIASSLSMFLSPCVYMPMNNVINSSVFFSFLFFFMFHTSSETVILWQLHAGKFHKSFDSLNRKAIINLHRLFSQLKSKRCQCTMMGGLMLFVLNDFLCVLILHTRYMYLCVFWATKRSYTVKEPHRLNNFIFVTNESLACLIYSHRYKKRLICIEYLLSHLRIN